ncbi:sugar ABC transporter permease [Frondihabitans sucicola]|uniref:Sugar ABC transporter permease n=1 Tax=Frondihabitans sucicola TaxID=1268041 RepID=A0ABM8GIF5_9MICO|nr:carbohydrate ABC transporter permease [Frondihabitans sucicola]BDZ47962.1 sugar ABC transporter permease [Frondihabitans sucicola]
MSVITYVVLVVAALLAVAPLYWMFVVGSNTSAAISSSPPVLLPGPNFLSNVLKVQADVPFVHSLLNSAIVALSVAVLQIFFCSLAGFAFAKLRFRGRNGLFVFIIATMAIPSQLGLVPLYLIMSKIGWIDSLQALIAPGAVTAFGVFWMRQVIVGSMPDELIEAARIDGCSTFRTFRSIVFPTIRGAAAVFGLFAAMSAWNDFLWPLVELSTPSHFTVQVAIQQLRTNYQSIDYATTLAASFLATLPLLILFVVAGKQLVAGIMEGAVKG